MPKTEYHSGRIGDLVRWMADRFNVPPFALQAEVEKAFPALQKKEECANCGASMAEYRFRFDCLDAALLLAMGRQVKMSIENRMPFTEANAVHVPSLKASLAVRCRTSQCRMLGLVAKLDGPNGRQIPGMWVITARGWAALRGEEVPESVVTFRNEIRDRTDVMITLRQALEANKKKVEMATAQGRSVPADYTASLAAYDPAEWVDIEKYGQGNLL